MNRICKNCGYTCDAKKEFGCGSFILFSIIAVCAVIALPVSVFLLPIFLIGYFCFYIFSGDKLTCPSCKAKKSMISIDSPIGQKLYKQYYQEKK